ncbi:MAG: 4Fe-4S binding protein, partial [Oscillospiraceae bacterium]|nr:4Fe-4S binding protein [Oscillospiraceae bacterium]
GEFDEAAVELAGDPLDSFIDRAFKADRGPIRAAKPGGGPMQFANRLVVPKPYIIADKCKKCGVCVGACPVKPPVVDWHDGNKQNPPAYQYRRCIRCYCCQELCPEGAVGVKKPLLNKVFSRQSGKKKK